MMIRNEKGFSLVELMVTMVVFVLVIAASSQVFTALLTQFKQQSKIGESNIEGMVGLDIFRRDIAGAGFGLPRSMSGVTYNEAANDGVTVWDDTAFNDATSNPPAALRSGPGAGLNGSDVLVIKSANVAFDDGAQKWSYISNRGATTTIKNWGSGSTENLASADRVIVLDADPSSNMALKKDSSGNFFSQWGTDGDALPTELKPDTNSYRNYVAYGIYSNPNTSLNPRMPFNRADYYLKVPTTPMPSRCAPNTGILYKGVVNQSNGMHTELPIIDCVVSMKVDYFLDTDNNGIADLATDDISSNAPTAQNVREMLKEVRVYIVAQEGQKDINYDYSNGGTRSSTMSITDALGTVSRSITVDLATVTDWTHYRWKIYTIAVQPNNLR